VWGVRDVSGGAVSHHEYGQLAKGDPRGAGLPPEQRLHRAAVHRHPQLHKQPRMTQRDSGGVVSFSCCDGLVYLLGYTGSV
jgi:hypothetical protein